MANLGGYVLKAFVGWAGWDSSPSVPGTETTSYKWETYVNSCGLPQSSGSGEQSPSCHHSWGDRLSFGKLMVLILGEGILVTTSNIQ